MELLLALATVAFMLFVPVIALLLITALGRVR